MGSNFCSNRKDFVNTFYTKQHQQFQTKYTITETIGRGSYSQVKLAYRNINNKKVAVKIIEKTQILKNNLYLHILREKQILQNIQCQLKNKSPFIISLHECSQDFQHLYFVMEYASNGDLRKLLKNKKNLSMQKIKFFCVCILLALSTLHKKNIIHGDIKPENILIDNEGYFKIADFSSAQYYNCKNTQIKGTKGYIAPEIKKQNVIQLHNNSSDLYSFGVILWQMAHGCRYINHIRNQQNQCHDIQLTGDSSDQSVDNLTIDPMLEKFIESLLKENLEERQTIQNVWSDPWLNLSQGEIKLYKLKSVYPHPFQPLEDYFDYVKLPSYERLSKTHKNSFQQSDSLLSSVLLNQKKCQNLFASFSIPSKQKDIYKKGRINQNAV